MRSPGDLSVDMVDKRRSLISLLVGSLLLLSVGAQASAVESDTAALAIAERGLALGLQVSDEIEADLEDGVAEGEAFGHALVAFEAVISKLAEKLDDPNFNGRGPERALEVHQFLAENLPPQVKADSDRIPGLAKAYGHMRAQLKGEGRGSGADPSADTP